MKAGRIKLDQGAGHHSGFQTQVRERGIVTISDRGKELRRGKRGKEEEEEHDPAELGDHLTRSRLYLTLSLRNRWGQPFRYWEILVVIGSKGRRGNIKSRTCFHVRPQKQKGETQVLYVSMCVLRGKKRDTMTW